MAARFKRAIRFAPGVGVLAGAVTYAALSPGFSVAELVESLIGEAGRVQLSLYATGACTLLGFLVFWLDTPPETGGRDRRSQASFAGRAVDARIRRTNLPDKEPDSGGLRQPLGVGLAAGAGLTTASAAYAASNDSDDDAPRSFADSCTSGIFDPHKDLFDTSGPSVNIDGSPMIGMVDIHGNPYGVTSTAFDDSWSCDIGSGSFSNDIGGSIGGGFDD